MPRGQMATERLYWTEPLLLRFAGTVTAHADAGERPAVLLAESAFYPEAGGQLADRGVLRWEGAAVDIEDAQEDSEGQVLHLLPPGSPRPPVGAEVEIEIDERRRRDHMSQHTGQHMLSRAFVEVGDAQTASARLGERGNTIDLAVNALPDRVLSDAEALVAALVSEDRVVRPLFPSEAELAALPLRKDPTAGAASTGQVRIVEIEGFDHTPCGGTHCLGTAQVGALRITGVERYKGGHRVAFLAGRRALDDYARKDQLLRELSRELTCGVDDIPSLVLGMRADAKARQHELGGLRAKLAEYQAMELLASVPQGPGVVAQVLPGETAESLRAIATRVAKREDLLLLLASTGDDARLIVQRGAALRSPHAGELVRTLAQTLGGRGGGRPERAEARLPTGAELESAVRRAFDAVQKEVNLEVET